MVLDQDSQTEFLNVDLDIRAHQGLAELLADLGTSMFVLHKTSTDASLELLGGSRSFNETVVELIDAVERLPQKAREIWHQCEYRRFNVGLQSGKVPHETLFMISSKSIARLAGIEAEIVITVYAPPKNGGAKQRQ